MTTLTAYSSFDATDGSDLGAADVVTDSQYYSSSYIELTSYVTARDQYLTYMFSGSFSGAGTGWSGTVSKFDFSVNYKPYYSMAGGFSYLGYWGLSADDPFAGNDVFVGSAENDYFVFAAGRGNDKFFGNGGNDYLQTNTGKKGTASGGDGDDFIVGNGVGDTLSGGSGNDVFRILSTGQKEVITDFDKSADILEVALSAKQAALASSLIMDASGAYAQPSASQIAVGSGYKSAKDADDLFAYDLKTGNLYFDKDGIGGTKAVQLATFKDKPQFSADDFAGGCLIVSVVGSTTLIGASKGFLAANEFGSM